LKEIIGANMAITISVNSEVIYTISNATIDLLAYDNPRGELRNILVNFISGLVDARIDRAKTALKNDWLPILIAESAPNGTIPARDAALAQLIFSRPDYKDYDARNPHAP
jgi:hypothetical protein